MNKEAIYNIAIPFIKEVEGLVLKPYGDEVEIKTIGYGHKILAGEKFGNITMQEAENILNKDLDICFNCATNSITSNLNNNQVAALLSFIFNIGITEFKGSTMLKLINQNNTEEASNEFAKWVYVTLIPGSLKKISDNLISRRKKEQELFCKSLNFGN